jgi:hypothetical protein
MHFTAIERPYLWLLGTALLLEGATLLAVGALPADVPLPLAGAFAPDPLHNAIHVAWGLAIVILLASGLKESGASLLAISFGVFYIGLAIAGTLVAQPFGLHLGPAENAFHWIVGPASLVIGIMALRERSAVGTI